LASGRVCQLLSIGVAAGGWLVIGAAWLLNRDWFNPLHGAFSDLGSSRASHSYVFNMGLVAVAALLALLARCLYRAAGSKAAAVGAGYLGLAAVFLAQVGLFPEGTVFHNCVALWFFLLADAGLLLYSLEVWRRGGCCLAALLSSAAMIPGAVAVELLIGWPSIATLEAYTIALLDIAVVCIAVCLFTGRRLEKTEETRRGNQACHHATTA